MACSLLLMAVSALVLQSCRSTSEPSIGRGLQPAADPQGAASPQPFAKATVMNLLKQALAAEFTPGREILVDLVDVPPNTTLERHWHPGEEFHYYLEGEPEVTIEGAGTVHAKPGTVGHIPYKTEHVLSTGATGAKVIVFRVHTAGEPMRYLVTEKDPKRP